MQRIGLDEVATPEYIHRLKLYIGFVLAMYNTAKSIFEKYKYVHFDTNAKLSILMITRFRMLPGIHPIELATKWLKELKFNREWEKLDIKEKFFSVCKYMFAAEMKIEMKPMAINPFFAKDEVIESMSQPIIEEILIAVFKEIPWTIREKGRQITTTKTWGEFSDQFVKSVRETLGAEKFDSLTLLAEKYHLFDQDLFARPESFTDIQDELTNLSIVGLLTSMGNELARHNNIEDAEEVFRLALTLRPEHSAARGSLAFICHSTGRLPEAKEHAQQAITSMDRDKERYKDIDVPKDIVEPNAIDSFRSILRAIAEENESD